VFSWPRDDRRRGERNVFFLGEQVGTPEASLKRALVSAFRRFPSVERAYLARLGFGPSRSPSVALCISPVRASSRALLDEVELVFAAQFAADAHLDVLFVDAQQESELRQVCSAFFARE
jgi:hypothetical protein